MFFILLPILESICLYFFSSFFLLSSSPMKYLKSSWYSSCYIMAIQEMLIGYRSTPHPATGITPYEGMMNRTVRTKLDYENRISNTSDKEKLINERDRQYKEKVKQKAENKNTKEHSFDVGDHVFLEQPKKNKWSTEYEPEIYIIYKIKRTNPVHGVLWGQRKLN